MVLGFTEKRSYGCMGSQDTDKGVCEGQILFFCYQYNFMHSAYALLRILIVHSDGNQSWTWLDRIPCCMGYIAQGLWVDSEKVIIMDGTPLTGTYFCDNNKNVTGKL